MSHSTYQRHKSDCDQDAMVSGAGITAAMEVEDSSDSDSEAGDTGDLDDRDVGDLGFGDESGMEVDDIPGNYTENSEMGMV